MESCENLSYLEKMYQPSCWSHRLEPQEVLENYYRVTSQESERVKRSVPSTLGIRYGRNDGQKLDVFGADALPQDAPIFVFLHGGFWIEGSRENSSYFVKPMFDAKIISIVIGYDLISEDVTIPDIENEIKEGLNFVLDYAVQRKSRGVYLCGHSVGGQLITMAVARCSLCDDHAKLLKGVILISAILDLKPLLEIPLGKQVRLTNSIADRSSPVEAIDEMIKNLMPDAVILIVAAEYDSPEFKKQSQIYHQSLESKGKHNVFKILPKEDHFSIVENLRRPCHFLTKEIIQLIENS